MADALRGLAWGLAWALWLPHLGASGAHTQIAYFDAALVLFLAFVGCAFGHQGVYLAWPAPAKTANFCLFTAATGALNAVADGALAAPQLGRFGCFIIGAHGHKLNKALRRLPASAVLS